MGTEQLGKPVLQDWPPRGQSGATENEKKQKNNRTAGGTRFETQRRCHHATHKWARIRHIPRVKSEGKLQKRKVDVTRHNTCHTRGPSMAPSATPATQKHTSRHNQGNASYPRKRVRVISEGNFRVTTEGLSL
jgi:hypothetical protein